MKAIINGVKYDTETAIEIISTKNGIGQITTLYRKKKNGEYFLVETWDNRPIQNIITIYGGSSYLNSENAKKWCEKNITVEEYESVFGEVEE